MRSPHQLRLEAKNVKFTAATPLRHYLRVMPQLLTIAYESHKIGDEEKAYIYYYRYLHLINKLSSHDEVKRGDGVERDEYFSLVKLEVPTIFKIIEDMNVKLAREWEKQQLALSKNIPSNINNNINSSSTRSRSSSNISVSVEPKKIKAFDDENFNKTIRLFNQATTNITTPLEDNTTNQTSSLCYPELPKPTLI